MSLLAELATNKECAEVIEQQAGLHQFVQANFCNQYGVLKTIAEVAGHGAVVANSNSSHASIILQHVTTLMQRLQDHKNQPIIPQQQQQQPMIPVDHQFGGMPPQQQQQQAMYYNHPMQQNGMVYNQPPQQQQQSPLVANQQFNQQQFF